MSVGLITILSVAVKIENSIKLRATNSVLCALCEDFGTFLVSLLLNIEVNCCSSGKILTRLSQLKSDVQ